MIWKEIWKYTSYSRDKCRGKKEINKKEEANFGYTRCANTHSKGVFDCIV